MPRRLLGILILLLEFVMQVQAQGDAVLLKVGSEAVCVKEFKYFYKRSLNKDVRQFLQSFIDYKVKLQHAKELGLDTLKEYRLQKESFSRVTLPVANISQSVNREKDWIKVFHVTVPLNQHATPKEELEAKLKLDSLHVEWRNGADWKQIAEELPWIETRYLLKEWQEQLKSLYKDQLSMPFYSPVGMHLIAWTDKNKTCAEIEPTDENGEAFFRLQEIKDGLLIASLVAKTPKETNPSERVLEAYFKQNLEIYGGGIPHFRGMVIHCKSKKEAKAIKKYLRKYPRELWAEAIERMPGKVSEKCLYEVGMFKIGENAYVDKLVFKCGNFSAVTGYPYTWVLGEKLKKGPQTYRDVKDKVEKDYARLVKTTRMEQLRQKIGVEINEEVLKTVNNEGNN